MRIEGMWCKEKGENKPWLGKVVAAYPSSTGQTFYLLVMPERADGAEGHELITVSSAGVIVADEVKLGPKGIASGDAKK